MTKKEKLLKAIATKQITDKKSALDWVMRETEKEKLIEEVIAEIKEKLG